MSESLFYALFTPACLAAGPLIELWAVRRFGRRPAEGRDA